MSVHSITADRIPDVSLAQWHGMFIRSLIAKGVNWFWYVPFSSDEERKWWLSNRNIFVRSLSRSPHENFPKFCSVCAHTVFEDCRRVWNLFLPLSQLPCSWDHEAHCSLERKSKYWVALTEVIVSPCLDTTSNRCLLDRLSFPWIYKCMNCFVFGCIKCTSLPDKFQNWTLDLSDKSLLELFFSLQKANST